MAKTELPSTDVAGIDEAKEELQEVTFLKQPERFTAIGAASPKVLLLAPRHWQNSG